MWCVILGCLIPRFPFWDPSLSPDHSIPPLQVEVTESGLCHGVVVWWSLDLEGMELNMDPWKYQQVCYMIHYCVFTVYYIAYLSIFHCTLQMYIYLLLESCRTCSGGITGCRRYSFYLHRWKSTKVYLCRRCPLSSNCLTPPLFPSPLLSHVLGLSIALIVSW